MWCSHGFAFAERHMQRISRLLQASMFLDYMWQKMRVTGNKDRWAEHEFSWIFQVYTRSFPPNWISPPQVWFMCEMILWIKSICAIEFLFFCNAVSKLGVLCFGYFYRVLTIGLSCSVAMHRMRNKCLFTYCTIFIRLELLLKMLYSLITVLPQRAGMLKLDWPSVTWTIG